MASTISRTSKPKTPRVYGPPWPLEKPAGPAVHTWAAWVAAGGILGRMSRLQRITSDPAVCHGQPTVRGLRYPVENLLELLSSGMTIDEVLDDYPDLERDDLLAALEFGALAAGGGRVVPLGAA